LIKIVYLSCFSFLHCLNKSNTQSEIVFKNGEYLVYRKGDRKVLKSVNYSPADLASIVEASEV
ncbi:MAG: hypothetical protein AAFR14_02110, partial [Bacteroidota bacterium]